MNENMNGDTIVTKPEAASRTLSLSEKVRSLRLADKMGKSDGGVSKGMVWTLAIILGVLAVALVYNISTTQSALKKLDELEKKTAAAPKKDDEDETDTGSSTEPAAPRDEIAVQYKGFIIPISTILVSPQVGGKVEKLTFREGQTVKKDELLAEIEKTEFKADFDRCSASAGAAKHRWELLTKYRGDEEKQAEADLEDTKAQLQQAALDYKRSQSLRFTNALAARDFEEAEAKYRSLEARRVRLDITFNLLKKGPRDSQIAAAAQEMKQAEADVDKARWRLNNCTVRAPITGVILSKKAEENNQVNPSAFSNGLAASLCELADLTELEIDVSIVERDRTKIKANQACRIRVDAWPGKAYEGYVSRIMPAADRSKNAIPVRVKISKRQLAEDMRNGGPFLLPDMSAVVMFLNRETDPKGLE